MALDITIYLYASEAKYQARRVSSNQLFLDLKIPSKTIGDVEKQPMLRLFTLILLLFETFFGYNLFKSNSVKIL